MGGCFCLLHNCKLPMFEEMKHTQERIFRQLKKSEGDKWFTQHRLVTVWCPADAGISDLGE